MGRASAGVEIREASIRLNFTLGGERVRETLSTAGVPWAPTAANEKRARRLAAEVTRNIEHGTLADVYAELFPDSKRVLAEDKADTIGKLLELFVDSKRDQTAGTVDQYETASRFWKQLLGADTKTAALTHKVLKAKIGGFPWTSAKTRNNYLIALRGAFALEFSGPRSLNNPMIGIANGKVTKRLPDPLTVVERDRILAIKEQA